MKIAILNHCYLTQDHREQLKMLGDVVEYQNTTTEKDAIERLAGVEVVVADMYEFPLNSDFFAKTKELKYVCLNSTGFNLIDLNAARNRGITISNLPGFSTEAVAEHTIALMFAVMHNVVIGNQAMHKEPFQLNPADRTQDMYISMNVRGKTIGIVGLGQIGTRVAELAKGLGMKVIAYNRSPKNIPDISMVELDTLFRDSDVITVTSAFDENLGNLINENALNKMRSTAVIVNIARGEFIDENALAKSLTEKRIGGLGADVIADWSMKNQLLKFDNVVLTPHMAFLASESLENMANMIVVNIKSYISGKPINVVNL